MNAPAGPLAWLNERGMHLPGWAVAFFSRPGIALVAMRIATAVDGPLLRLSRGRLRLSFVVPVLLLECPGRRSGRLRRTPLLYVPDGDGLLLVGSNAGQARAPAWCANLRAAGTATCVVGGHRLRCAARELGTVARAQALARAVAFYPGYDAYRARAGRRLPVFRLEPLEAV